MSQPSRQEVLDTHLRKANQLLALLSIPLRVQHLNELTPAVWTVVYEALFRTSLDVSAGVAYGDTEATASTAPPSTPDERNGRTMERIMRTLERSVIRMSLSHISVDGLVEGRLVDVCQLLDLFLELARSIAVRLRERRVLTADVEGTLVGASPSGRGHTGMAADPVLSSLRRDTTPPPMVHRAGGGSYAQLIDDVVEVTEERDDDARPSPSSPSTTVRAVPSKPATSLSQLVDDIPTYITGGLANNANSGRGGAPRQRQSRSPKRLFPQQRGSPKKARQAVRSRPADASAHPAPAATAQAPTKELRFADPKVDELQLATASLEDRYHKTAGIGSPAKRQVITTTTITDYRPRTVKLSTSGVRSGTAASKSSLATPQLRVRSMTLPADEAAQAMRNVTRLIEDTLPGVDIPDWIRKATWKKQVETWDKIVKDAKLEERISAIRLGKAAQQEADTKTPVDIAARDMQKDARRQFFEEMDRSQQAAAASLRNRHRAVIRLNKRVKDIDADAQSYLLRRRDTEERLVKRMMDESVKLQRDAIRDMRRYRKEEEERALEQKMVRAEAKRNYLRDQVEMMQESLKRAEEEERVRQKNLKEELIRAQREQKQALKHRINVVKGRLQSDGMDFYFREKDVVNAIARE